MGRQNLETRLVESLLVVCLSVFAISNRCSKDSCCAHKGLVTNWPHHSRTSRHEIRSVDVQNDIILRLTVAPCEGLALRFRN